MDVAVASGTCSSWGVQALILPRRLLLWLYWNYLGHDYVCSSSVTAAEV